jgi:hypothetical protein
MWCGGVRGVGEMGDLYLNHQKKKKKKKRKKNLMKQNKADAI